MAFNFYIVLSAVVVVGFAQRPSYAGLSPIGYPTYQPPTTTQNPNDLGNRFGDDNAPTTTTMRLPVEALGDRDLINRLSQLPVDQQPFWFINWQALENDRKQPHTYAQRPAGFGGVDLNQNMNMWW
ncbi:hypothetical protein O0L34_g360 [Tuta absoluta]|nr:hypothetical protein O0L34_g360 [Tuta absoluta]